MPPMPSAAGVIELVMRQKVDEDLDVVDRVFIHYTGTAPNVAELNTFATFAATAWGSDMSALQHTGTALLEVTATDLSSPSGARGVDVATVNGTRVGLQLPANAVCNVQFQIARRYRGGKPKVFLSVGSAADLSDAQTWGSTFLGNVVTGWDNFMTAVVGAGWSGAGTLTHVNVSYFSGFTVVVNPTTGRARNVPTLRATPVIDPVIGYRGALRIASQRRRG